VPFSNYKYSSAAGRRKKAWPLAAMLFAKIIRAGLG
jgi:hypothetical protein